MVSPGIWNIVSGVPRIIERKAGRNPPTAFRVKSRGSGDTIRNHPQGWRMLAADSRGSGDTRFPKSH